MEGKVGIYVCGVTVYDYCHIGHARSAIVFDVLVRYLRARGYDVTYVRNFTDVDDKIIDRAKKLGKETNALAQEYIDAFYEDMGRLGVLKADKEPRATEHIGGMIDMIHELVNKEYAYVVGDEVFFSVEAFEDYGTLSGRKLDEMKAGSRIAVDEKKRHPMDFVLWKGAKPDEPQWPSPWGPGRPGWHMECSVMSGHFLGDTFDIHGGGKDLLFPHHENERAQSIGATGGGFAKYWVHNGFVTVESEKMSKSLGNFLTIRDALNMYPPQVLRLFLLSKHYRSPLDFSRAEVLGMQSGLVRIYRALQKIEEQLGSVEGSEGGKDNGEGRFAEHFNRLMEDDLNTAGAIGLIFEKVREMNKLIQPHPGRLKEESRQRLLADRRNILAAGHVLGLLEESPQDFFAQLSRDKADIDQEMVERLIEERTAARSQKDWAKADEIRDRLKEMNVVLEDGPGGTTWRLDV
jgi:cysteinyl-tRNA synthetase